MLYEQAYNLLLGRNCDTDIPKSWQLLQACADKWHTHAMVLVGKQLVDPDFDFVEQDQQKGEDLICAAMYSGNVLACYLCLMKGFGGVPVSKSQAFVLLSTEGDLEDPYTLNRLGCAYSNGEGVEQDFGRAVELFQRAADMGLVMAIHNLGMSYEHGEGVQPDLEKAFELYKLATQREYLPAIHSLVRCYRQGIGCEADEEKVQELNSLLNRPSVHTKQNAIVLAYATLADAKDMNGCFNLGKCCARGWGTSRDRKDAKKMFTRAKNVGHPAAQLELNRLISPLNPWTY